MSDISAPTFQLTGIASGMDWGNMIDEQMKKARKVEDVWYDEIQDLTDKIYLYDEYSGQMKTAKSSLDALKLESTFTAKQIDITALAGAPDSGFVPESSSIMTVDVTPEAKISRWDIQVKNLAVAERRVSDRLDDISTPLNQLGFNGSGQFSIRSGIHAAVVEYDASTDSLEDLVEKINDTGVGVKADIIDNRLVLESVDSGRGENTITDTITRNPNGNYDDLAGINVTNAEEIDHITVGKTTYDKGVDFTIEEGDIGWVVKWADGHAPAAGTEENPITYEITYDYDANPFDIYQRAEDGNLMQKFGILTDDVSHHTEAMNASLTLNGIEISRSSNDIDDLIKGTTLHLHGRGTIRADVTQDAEKAVESVKSFVDAYNGLMDYINVRTSEQPWNYSQKPSDKNSRTRPTDDLERRKGLLKGDPMLYHTKTRLRQIISDPLAAKGELKQLSQIGISSEKADYGKSGKLKFDTKKFMEAMKENSSDVQELTQGVAEKLDGYLDSMISSTPVNVGGYTTVEGQVTSQKKSWQTQINGLRDRINDHEDRLSLQQDSLYKQYTYMEQMVAKFNAQSSWLAGITQSLSSMSSGAQQE